MNDVPQYLGLFAGYGTAAVGWLLVQRRLPGLWPLEVAEHRHFNRPWREFAYAIVACVGVVLVGQLYQAGIRLPTDEDLGVLWESTNQFLIFSPVLLLLLVRRQRLLTAWLPGARVPQRLLVGLALAMAALFGFLLVRGEWTSWPQVLCGIFQPRHLDKAVQVLLEDLTIAVLMCRLAEAVGRFWLTAGVVGALFAAGHIPAMVAGGEVATEFIGLLFDAALALFMIRILLRSADIWWLWCVHFTMDMTQFVVGHAAP